MQFPGSDQYPFITPLQEVIAFGTLDEQGSPTCGEINTVGMGRVTLLCQYGQVDEDGVGVSLTIYLSPYIRSSDVPVGEVEWWPLTTLQVSPVTTYFPADMVAAPSVLNYTYMNTDGGVEAWTIDLSLPSHAQRIRVCADEFSGEGEGAFGCYAILSGHATGDEFGWTAKTSPAEVSIDGAVNVNLQVSDTDVDETNPVPTDQIVRAFNADLTDTPAADTDAVVTLAAGGAGVSNCIRGIAWGYSEAPTAGSLKIEDGAGTTVFFMPITGAGAGFIPIMGKGSANTALIVTLAAGGGTCVGSVNVLEAWTE